VDCQGIDPNIPVAELENTQILRTILQRLVHLQQVICSRKVLPEIDPNDIKQFIQAYTYYRRGKDKQYHIKDIQKAFAPSEAMKPQKSADGKSTVPSYQGLSIGGALDYMIDQLIRPFMSSLTLILILGASI
jgi:hypothetical protein